VKAPARAESDFVVMPCCDPSVSLGDGKNATGIVENLQHSQMTNMTMPGQKSQRVFFDEPARRRRLMNYFSKHFKPV
jgi:hypothetical protein